MISGTKHKQPKYNFLQKPCLRTHVTNTRATPVTVLLYYNIVLASPRKGSIFGLREHVNWSMAGRVRANTVLMYYYTII